MPPDETDKCQPLDQGEGYLLKALMRNELDKYLEKNGSLSLLQVKEEFCYISGCYPGNRKKTVPEDRTAHDC